MAKFVTKPEMKFTISLQLEESEARALLAMTYFGVPKFLEVFEKHLGTHLENHKDGLESLFVAIANELPDQLDKINLARQTFER